MASHRFDRIDQYAASIITLITHPSWYVSRG